MKRTVRGAALLLCLGVAASPARGLTLAEGLALLERSGREAAVAAAEEQVLASAREIAGAPRWPTVDAYTRETMLAYQPGAVAGPQTIDTAERFSYAAGVRVRQLVTDFGRTGAAVRAASLDLDGKRLETTLARRRSSLRFILAYVRLQRAEKLLAVQQEEAGRFEAHRDDARALLEEGAVTENDLLQAEVRLADAVQRRLQAENLRALAAAQVNSLLLLPLDHPVVAEEIPGPAVADPGLAEALAASRDRIELQQAAARIAATEARRSAVRTEYLPQVYVAGGYDFAQNEYQVHEGNWSVVAGVDVNLFAGGVTAERLLQKERELRALERAREQLQDAIALEVQEAFLALQTARSRVAAAAKAVEQGQENLRLQRLRYAEGVGTATEVLDAVSLLSTAEQNQLNARYDITDALARLDFAVGRDLAAAWGGGAGTTDPGGRP
jgi:outer membrane protein TolC